MKPFGIGEALAYGWEATRRHSAAVIFGALVLAVLGWTTDIFVSPERMSAAQAVGFLCCMMLTIIVSAGYNRMCLRIARNEPAALRDLIPPWSLAWPYFLASLLQIVAITGGFVLLIIPGLYLLVRLYFVGFSVIDGARPVESLKQSNRLSRGVFWSLALFALIQAALNWMGSVVFIGTLITMPVTTLASAHIYLKLKKA